MIDTLAGAKLTDNILFLVKPVFGDDDFDRLPERFVRRVSEQGFGSGVPGRDNAVERFREDRIVAVLDDGRKPRARFEGDLPAIRFSRSAPRKASVS